jgi:DNA replication protein DnaD
MAQQKELLKQKPSGSQILIGQKKELRHSIEQFNHLCHISTFAQQSDQELSISEIIRTSGKQFRQIRKQYTDGYKGRCVMGVIMSYYGWDGKCISNAERKLYAALRALRQAGISKELLIELNDSGRHLTRLPITSIIFRIARASRSNR